MQKLISLVGVMLVSSVSFASIPSTGLTKDSPILKSLGSAWNAHTSQQASQKHLTIVYGGEDVVQARVIDEPTGLA